MPSPIPASATVFTPDLLAESMVESVFETSDGLWLDPCVGSGAFVRPIRARGVHRDRLIAIDISTHDEPVDELANTIRGVDFISWAGTHRDLVRYVVMNPPYIAISKLSGRPRELAVEVLRSASIPRPGVCNYWCAFLVASVQCLTPGGSLVAVLPAAWEYADYSTHIRKYIEKSFAEVISYRSAQPLFPKVQDGAVVVVARHKGMVGGDFRHIAVKDLDELVVRLRSRDRPDFAGTTEDSAVAQLRLRDAASVGIGAVTGDARYFLLTEEQRLRNRLTEDCLVPVLSKGRHIATSFIDEAWWTALRTNGERVWMFRPNSEQLDDVYVQEYLGFGKLGGCRIGASHIRKRNPWYSTPIGRRADAFVSGMTRALPVLALSRWHELIATNTLYQVHFRDGIQEVQQVEIALSLLTSEARRFLDNSARHYPDGLVKLEPKDLTGCPIRFANPSVEVVDVYKDAVRALSDGQPLLSEEIANGWFGLENP